MANEFKKIMISFLLIGLFTVLVTTAIYQLSLGYGVDTASLEVATGGSLNMDDYETELNNSNENAQDLRIRFEEGKVDDVDDPSSLFSVAGDIIGVITTPFNVLASIGSNVLGIPTIAVKVILAILNISLILGLWAVLRSGS